MRALTRKNLYDRQTPCDQDYLRKVAKDTDAQALMRWFGEDGVRVFQRRRAFDREGIFIGDASYLFVPDNPRYEGSVKLLFDEHNHPLSEKQYHKMTDEQKSRCQWRRCYKMVTLLHTNRALDFFLFVAMQVVSGNAHECPVLYDLVKQFVQTAGKGAMKRLILDRGFLDGKAISLCKSDNYIIVNYRNYYGLFRPFELIGFVVKLGEEARKKIAAKCERIGRELESALMNPRPP